MLVYDFGGGALAVTVLKIENRNIETVATAVNSTFGGKDIDI